MSVQLINWTLQLIAAGFSAVVGAAALLALQTALKRGKFLQALQNELEINQNRLERQIYRIESQGDTQFSAFHTGVYEAIRINDPTLFLSVNSEILGFEDMYEEFNTLDELSEAGVMTKTPQDQLLQSHQQLITLPTYCLRRTQGVCCRHA